MDNTNTNDPFAGDPSHATPGVDANNPPVKKIRLDADVVGNNPAEGIKAPSANLPENQPAGEKSNPILSDDPELSDSPREYKAEAPEDDNDAGTNGTMAASDDASQGDIPELNPDGSAARQMGTPSEVDDEPVNTEAAEVAEDPSNVIGQNQVEAENANAEAMTENAKAEENQNNDPKEDKSESKKATGKKKS